ncbi:unnamed protein product, partial [Closterium sp. NIES-53]
LGSSKPLWAAMGWEHDSLTKREKLAGDMDRHDLHMQRTYARREQSPSLMRRSRERGRSPTRSSRRAAYRADPVTPTGGRREGSREDVSVRSEPWRRPTTSNPWNLAGGQHGGDGRRQAEDMDVDPAGKQGEEEGREDTLLARGGGRHVNANGEGSPTARGGGRHVNANDEGSPTARGGGRHVNANDEGSPTARGGGRHVNADGEGSPTARGGGRHVNADDEGSPTTRGGGRHDNTDDEGSPTARGGGRHVDADDEGSPTARGGGRHVNADDEGSPTARGGGRRISADDEVFTTARGGGRRSNVNDEGSPTARGGGRRVNADDEASPTARGGERRSNVDEGDFPAARREGKRGDAGKREQEQSQGEKMQEYYEGGETEEGSPMRRRGEGDCREPVRKVQELVTKKLGKGVRCDAARLGARAHRVRRYWQNIVADEQLQQELDGIRRDWGRTVKEILEPGRAAAPVRKGRHETQCPCNKVGAERRAWLTLVGYEGAAGFREEDGMPGEGMVYDSRTKKWEEPTALERELAMGYGEEVTKAVGVTERERRRALGQAMDGQVMLWLVRRMWRGLVLEEEKEQGSEGTRVKQVGAWACMAAKEEPKWVVGNAMGEKGKEAMQEVLARYRHAFAFTLQELGKCSVKEMDLRLVTDEPVFQRKRRMTPGDEDICKEKCRELMEARLIQRSESEYATPTVVAARKDLLGEVLSRRMCGDYRALNKVTVPGRYPMPTAEDIFDRLGAGEIFSTLDLRQGFNQIRIRKEDVRKTAFHGADGLYEWLFMPFGLRNASAIFQRVMDSVLRGLEFAACYIVLETKDGVYED